MEIIHVKFSAYAVCVCLCQGLNYFLDRFSYILIKKYLLFLKETIQVSDVKLVTENDVSNVIFTSLKLFDKEE